jgi:hypothetical protein
VISIDDLLFSLGILILDFYFFVNIFFVSFFLIFTFFIDSFFVNVCLINSLMENYEYRICLWITSNAWLWDF